MIAEACICLCLIVPLASSMLPGTHEMSSICGGRTANLQQGLFTAYMTCRLLVGAAVGGGETLGHPLGSRGCAAG